MADVKINIADVKGEEVFSTISKGPWLFVDLPEGLYNISAVFRSCVVKKERVIISAGVTAEAVIRWDLGKKGYCR